MAKSTGGTLLTLGLVGVAGYIAYEYFLGGGSAGGAMPSDALPVPGPGGSYGNGLPIGSTFPADIAKDCGPGPFQQLIWPYYSASQGKYYCSTSEPTQAQINAYFAAAKTAASQQVTAPPTPTQVLGPAVPVSMVPASSGVAVPATSTLDQIYQQIKAGIKTDPNFAGSGDSATGTTDQFNYYLNLYRGAYNLPDVLGSVFPTSQTLTLAQFWAAMAPALKAAVPGLSGLGFYGGLGAIVYARRGRF